MRTRLAAIICAIGALGALAPSGAPASPRTTATVYHAFTASGSPALPTRMRSGSCFTGALTIRRSDAWRCMTANTIEDPCFSSAAAPGEVVCPNPDLRAGVEIRLTRSLPRRFADRGRPSTRDQPWDIELTTGQHCSFLSGATTLVGGHRLNYGCARSLGLWGSPLRSSEPWTILAGPFDATSLHERRSIAHAWM